MKELKNKNPRTEPETRSVIIRDIVEFYKIQPGISASHLEKLEEYLVLINSLVVEAFINLYSLNNQVNPEDMIDVLNSYINSVVEEIHKVFPNQNLEIIPLNKPENISFSEIQEYLRKINRGEANRFGLKELLIGLSGDTYNDDSLYLIFKLIEKLIKAVNSEMIVKVEELL